VHSIRPAIAGLTVAALSLLGVGAIAAPASAAVVTVSDATELQDAFYAAVDLNTVVTLGASIDTSGGQVFVTQTATLDLAGNNLSVESLRLSYGVTLVIEDTVSGGKLTADASGSSYDAGIHTHGSTLQIEGATVEARGGTLAAAIGGEGAQDGGTITITSGDVTAIAGEYGAGIGGGPEGGAGTISIIGGTVTAQGGRAAAIGTGQYSTGLTGGITISGGTVTATTRDGTGGAAIGAGTYSEVGPISITGGTVTASLGVSARGAAIGSGTADPGNSLIGPTVTISGGTVNATGSDAGAAIGGSDNMAVASVTISGTADVTAAGGSFSAAIGTGYSGGTASITISGGTVNASNGTPAGATYAAAIGGGYASEPATISITGGTVSASTNDSNNDSQGAAIGSGSFSTPGSVTISSGIVNASGGAFGAGIGGGNNTPGGTILISGGTVIADSFHYGANIGGGFQAPGGSITISGGTVTALGAIRGAAIGGGATFGASTLGAGGVITISGGTVEAHQEYRGAAIGGGEWGDGGDVTIGASATVTGISDPSFDPSYVVLSIVGPGHGGVESGSLSVSGTLIVGTDSILDVPGTSTTIEAGGVVSGSGSVTGAGTLVNHGSITNTTVTVDVTDHNYLVTFEPNSDWAVPSTSTPVRVYAATFDDGSRSVPFYSTSNASWGLAGWGNTSLGPVAFDASTAITSSRTVYGVWAPIPLEIATSNSAPVAGDTVTFTTSSGTDSTDVTANTVFTTDSPDAFTGNAIRFLTAGTWTITASIGGYVQTMTIFVDTGIISELDVSPVGATVIAGNNQAFTADGYDVGHNYLGDFSALVNWQSTAGDSHAGGDFSFESAGARTITATYGSVVGSVSATVVAGDLDHLEISSAQPTVTSAGSVAFTAEGYDVFGNDIGDYTSLVTFSTNLGDDNVNANAIVFYAAGTRIVTATLDADSSITGSTDVEVTVGNFTFIDLVFYYSSGQAGDTINFTVSGYDSYGNSKDITDVATMVSDEPTDVLNVLGQSYTFTKASEHNVTATYGTFSDTSTFEITPGAPDHLVVATTPTGNVVAGESRAFTAASYDEYGNFVRDDTADTQFMSSNATDVEGATTDFGFTIAGTRQILAALYGSPSVTGSLDVTVVGDRSDPATMTITASSTTVDQYGTVTVTVSGFDQYGNPITGLESLVTLSSDYASDVISGNTITFPHASPHVITATLGSASATLLIQVTPAATGLADSGVEVISVSVLALLLLLIGASFMMYRRRQGARA
jgi:hypothetical protein